MLGHGVRVMVTWLGTGCHTMHRMAATHTQQVQCAHNVHEGEVCVVVCVCVCGGEKASNVCLVWHAKNGMPGAGKAGKNRRKGEACTVSKHLFSTHPKMPKRGVTHTHVTPVSHAQPHCLPACQSQGPCRGNVQAGMCVCVMLLL